MSRNVSGACREFPTLNPFKNCFSLNRVKLCFEIMTDFDRSIRNMLWADFNTSDLMKWKLWKSILPPHPFIRLLPLWRGLQKIQYHNQERLKWEPLISGFPTSPNNSPTKKTPVINKCWHLLSFRASFKRQPWVGKKCVKLYIIVYSLRDSYSSEIYIYT